MHHSFFFFIFADDSAIYLCSVIILQKKEKKEGIVHHRSDESRAYGSLCPGYDFSLSEPSPRLKMHGVVRSGMHLQIVCGAHGVTFAYI